MSSSDDKGKDAHLVAILEDTVVVAISVGIGLAVDGHQLHAAVLATGEVQFVQKAGHSGPAGQIDGGPALCLVGQESTEARKQLRVHGYGQVTSISYNVSSRTAPL